MNYKEKTFYVTCPLVDKVLKISNSGEVSVFLETGKEKKREEGFNGPLGIAIDQSSGNLFVSDCDYHLIQKISPKGTNSKKRNEKTKGKKWLNGSS